MMFMKTILALSFAAFALAAPTEQGGDLGGVSIEMLYGTFCWNPCPPGASLTDLI
jgi:hypothetical protein